MRTDFLKNYARPHYPAPIGNVGQVLQQLLEINRPDKSIY